MAAGWRFDKPSIWQLIVLWLAVTVFAALYIGVLAGLVIFILEYVV